MKIKTTALQNYLIRPNQEIIPSMHSLVIRCVTQKKVNDFYKLKQDRFLVQLAKIDLTQEQETKMNQEYDLKLTKGDFVTNFNVQNQEKLTNLWKQIDKKKII